jgi:folate-binding protein YgfZ
MPSLPGYDALLRGAAFVRRTDRGVVRLRGADRLSWLQGLVTNDVSGLTVGQRRYAALLTPQGRMVTDLWVVETVDATLLDVPASLAAHLGGRLDSLIFAEDVQVDEVSHDIIGVQLFGTADTASALAAVRDDTYGVPSAAVYVPALDFGHLESSWAQTHEPVGLEALDVLRIEAGVPRFLVDMTDDTIPLEAGIEDRAISFTKGCYVGQEIIVRVTTRGGGRVGRRLVGLRLADAAPAPHTGATLHAAGRAVGRVTSAAWSPRCDAVIGLGYVHRDFTDVGTTLEVHDDTRRDTATVHALPFVPSRA